MGSVISIVSPSTLSVNVPPADLMVEVECASTVAFIFLLSFVKPSLTLIEALGTSV